MAILTLHLPDDKHERLRELAQKRNVSVDRLIEDIATAVLDECDAEARFCARAAKGSPEEALRRLEKLNGI